MKLKSAVRLLYLSILVLMCAGCPQNKISVPDVVNMTQAAAQTAIEGAGLAVGAITNASSETVPAGNVISQNPAAGAKVDEGAAVDLVISTGPAVAGGKVIGWVRDPGGAPLPDVLVELDKPTKSGISFTNTNIDGLYRIDDIAPQDGLVLRFSRDGYTPNSQYVDIMSDVTTSANSVLLPLAPPETLIASTGGVIEDDYTGAKLTIPANAFVTAKGAVTGEVSVQMTPLDITDPDQLAAFPGNFRAVELAAKDGEVVTLETFGLVDIRVTQDLGKATETEVELAPGKTATIEIPLPPEVLEKQYEDLRLWWFSPETGIWQEESNENGGVAPSSGGSGVSFFAEITHFSWWNCDAPLDDKACVRGRVVDEEANPIAGAEVEARGISYDGSTYGTTDENGEFCLNVKGAATVEVRVTLPAGSAPVYTENVTVGAAGDSCEETGECTDLGDITAALDSCVHGVMRNANDQPMPGITVYSSAGTTDVTTQNGEFCLEVPGGSTVTVWSFGGTSVQTLTPENTQCPTGCAEIELRTVHVVDGAEVGFVTASESTEDDPFVFAQFAASDSAQALQSLAYLGYLGAGVSDVNLSRSVVPGIDEYVVFTSYVDYLSAFVGCDLESPDDYLTFVECATNNLGAVSALDPGAPGLAQFESGNSADMMRVWDVLEGAEKTDDFYTRIKALSYGQFVSANYLDSVWKTGAGPVNVSWPGGVNIGPFTVSVPEVPQTPVFSEPELSYPPNWWYDGTSSMTLTWAPQDPSMTLLINFLCTDSNYDDNLFAIVAWVWDDGSFTIPSSAFDGMTVGNYQSISAVRLASGTASVPFTGGAGNGTIRAESMSPFAAGSSVTGDFTMYWQQEPNTQQKSPVKAAPANDNLAAARTISGASGSINGTVDDATVEMFELDIEPYWAASVWYTWTAPEDAYYEFFLDNDALSVTFFDGTPALETIVAGGYGSSVYESFESGKTYKISVASYIDFETKSMFPHR